MNSPEATLPQLLRSLMLDWGIGPGQAAAFCRVSPEVFAEWLSRDVSGEGSVPAGMDNAVPLVAVYKRLQAFKPGEEGLKWLFSAHPEFGNEKPIDVMASSLENLYWVSYWLDSSRAAVNAATADAAERDENGRLD